MQQSQDNGVGVKLVDMPGIVKLWITIRVFSLASASGLSMQYRKVTKKIVKKSKPFRRQITSDP